MSIDLVNTDYNNFDEILYLNGGKDVSFDYVEDIELLKSQINNATTYTNSDNIQSVLKNYYDEGYYNTLELDGLEDYIANAFVENERLSKAELKNKLSYAIKSDNLDKNIKNNKLYNSALQKMVNEDIRLDKKAIETVKNNIHNKTRNLEIRQYYNEKMNVQTKVIKSCIIMFLILLF